MYQLYRESKQARAVVVTVGRVFFRSHCYIFSTCTSLIKLACLLLILYTLQSSWLLKSIVFEGKRNHFIPQDSCMAPPLNWTESENPRKSSKGIAALYTPYALLPGGGERYLLTFGKALIMQGYNIKLLVKYDNPTQTPEAVTELCKQMQIDLPAVEIQIVEVDGGKISNPPKVELFFALGNEKFPQVKGIGYINLYMCQFPFDLDRVPNAYEIINLFTYDNVILNSVFTLSWYNKYLLKHVQDAYYSQLPVIDLLYPPVPMADQKFASVSRTLKQSEVTIILLGRFFAGRQSKVCVFFHRATTKILYWYFNTSGMLTAFQYLRRDMKKP
jgi:hypothetical protein